MLLDETAYENLLSSNDLQYNYIPLGLLYVQGEMLTAEEIEDNLHSRHNNFIVAKKYEKVSIKAASVLKQFADSPQVIFELIPELYVNENGEVSQVRVDFGDGAGYQIVTPGTPVAINYGSPGEKMVAIEIATSEGLFFNHCTIKVLGYPLSLPDDVVDISVTKSLTGQKNGLVGGRAEVFVGCDGALDKPIIVVEGFDPTNVTSINNTRRLTLSSFFEGAYLNNGYDIVYLDFTDGGADIRDNSLVLQELIRDLNVRKVGANDLAVIGASMGGLVARHALRQLELANYTHNVSHYISYDSPHRGANVPVGLQTLLLDVDDILFRDIFGFGQHQLDTLQVMLNSKAARQMLLRYKGPSPHPDFVEWQKELNSLGFPSQGNIRNIAIVNGASGGARQAPITDYDPNDKIARVTTVSGGINTNINVRTNEVNGEGKVSSVLITSLLIPLTIKDKSFNFDALNYDISSGGISPTTAQTIELPWWGNIFNLAEWFGPSLQTFGRENFSFVPLFSSTAAQGALRTQAELNRGVPTLINNNLTPFDKIYAGADNTSHIRTFDVFSVWRTMLITEFSVDPLNPFCQVGSGGMGRAPTPRIDGTRFFMCEDDSSLRFWDRDASALANLFHYTWSVSGPSSLPGGVGDEYVFTNPSPGFYTISLTRTYNDDINGTRSATSSRVVEVVSRNSTRFGCSTSTPDGPTKPEKNIKVNADFSTQNYKPVILNVSPNPINSSTVEFQYYLPVEGKVSIEISPVAGGRKTVLVASTERKAGTKTESHKLGVLPSGAYVFTVRTSYGIDSRQIIVVQ
jgi:hypothetical protein